MRKMLKLVLCICLVCSLAGTACAHGVMRAAQLTEMGRFAHYPSYALDDETGRWQVNAYQADALVDRFWQFGIKNSSRVVVFHLAAEGDVHTGVWTPVLRFYHMDGEDIHARAVSLMADGERIDLAASSAEVHNGRYSAECITAPLDEQAVQFVSRVLEAETVVVRLMGEELHTVTLNPSSASAREMLEAESLHQLDSGLALLKELGADEYALWDLSAAAWKKAHGYAPASNTASAETALADVRDVMGMIVPDSSGTAVLAAQEALAEHGFLSGTPARTFDGNAVNAVLRAQHYLGRVPTGCYDAALQEALSAPEAVQEHASAELCALGDAAEIALERFWFADAVGASAAAEGQRSVVNADNVFLAADGLIRNLSPEILHLFVQLEASVVCNGRYAYEAELACESSGGTALDVRLLPLAQARLVVYAEIPAQLAMDGQAQWSIVFTHGSETLSFDLQ